VVVVVAAAAVAAAAIVATVGELNHAARRVIFARRACPFIVADGVE